MRPKLRAPPPSVASDVASPMTLNVEKDMSTSAASPSLDRSFDSCCSARDDSATSAAAFSTLRVTYSWKAEFRRMTATDDGFSVSNWRKAFSAIEIESNI